MHQNILERLRTDPGQRTLGELLQDREAALHEILRLRKELERHQSIKQHTTAKPKDEQQQTVLNPGMLVRLSDLSKILGVSRSTVYRWVSEGMFPEPVRIGERAVRWRSDDINAWRESL